MATKEKVKKKIKAPRMGGPGQIFEIVASLHLEPMNDGTGRIRTYTAGEFCQDPFGRNLVETFPGAFKYAPVGVSPKFDEGECDDTLEEVALGFQSDQRKRTTAKKNKAVEEDEILATKKAKAAALSRWKDEVENEVEEDVEEEEEDAVEDEDAEEEESDESDLVVDDLDDEEKVEDDEDEPAPKMKSKKPEVLKKKKKKVS